MMTRRMMFTGLLMSGFLAGFAQAQNKKPAADAAGEKAAAEELKVSDAKPGLVRASTVNFPKELHVTFAYLTTLGGDIAQARKQADPVGLAAAARSLEAAEAASGKKASVTSAEVMREAIELALLRGVPSELKAMKVLTADTTAQEKLTTAQAAAEKRAEDEKADIAAGVKTKAFFGDLDVVNQSQECVDIYVNGIHRAHVEPGERVSVHIHHHGQVTTLQAICEDGDELRKEYVSYGTHKHWHLR